MSKKKIVTLLSVIVITGGLTGCVKPYNTPEFVEITPSQTAFLIPMIGDSTEQVQLDSEEALAKNMVSAKRIQIPKEWVQTKRASWKGKYMDTAKLIVVERKPVTREWTEAAGEGTSNANQAITAETKESIGFRVRISITANIQENDAVKFLYNYNTKTLEEIMDSEIRARVESKFNEEAAKYALDDLLINKESIMETVRNDVINYFKGKGITISTLGLKGEITYLDPSIQESINAKFTAQKEAEAQAIINQKNIEQAQAEADAIRTQSSTLEQQIQLKEAEAKKIEAEAKLKQAEAMANWDVQVLGDNPIVRSN